MRNVCATAPSWWSSVLLTAGTLVWFAVATTGYGQPPEQLPIPAGDNFPLSSPQTEAADQGMEEDLIDEVIEPALRFRLDPIRSLLVRTKQKVSRIS